MRSPENVLESLKSKACNQSYKYERLYRNLYNPQFYLLAYQRIQAKPGNMTAGTDGKTIDGMGMARINALIEKMRDFSYQPNPARRTYIPKSNGKMRPLGIPSFDDKLIQEVVRLILESIYEPTFSDHSHGFRINKSCHTALKYVQKYFTGTKWFVEGDIKGCFDNVDHHVLIAILRKRIADEHFIGLLWKFLKAGYMEDWNYHNTYSGTPQGSIISPILANIYLNELDKFMAEYAEKFNCGERRKINPAFKKKLDVCRGKEQRLKRNISKMSEEEKEGLLAEIRELRRSLRSIPYSDQMDEGYKRVFYIRYADDFLIGVIGRKADAEQVKQDVGRFIRENLHLEMSEEKTLITHGHDFAKFLGYEVTIAKGECNKKTKTGATRRVNNGKVMLYVPHDKWVKRLLSYHALKIKHDKQNGNKEVWEPVRRTRLLHLDDLEILNQYNAEIRGLYNYYRLANNVSVLNNFYYVMRYSIELFTNGSLNTFAKKTNVDTDNRLICYDILDLGKQLMPIGMLVVLDSILNRITQNRANGKNTFIFIDEIYLLFQHEYSANFLFTLWKRVRKYGAYATGITQNVDDLLQSHTARTMLANSEFIVMLNQASTDRLELAKLLNISDTQLSYITNVDAGHGLIKVGSSLVPFANKFPKNTKLYKLMTTKPGEGA